MSEPVRVAFKLGGFKRPGANKIVSSTIDFDTPATTNNDEPELVTSLDNGQIKSNTPVVPKQELVIPSQPNVHQQFFKLKTDLRKAIVPDTITIDATINQLDDAAKRALILDAQEANDAWNERSEHGNMRVQTIEQLSSNTFTNTLENGETSAEDHEKKHEEKIIENANYDIVPIEDFGMAVLRGMGYREDAGLGISNKKQAAIFVPEIRPRGLGLGADRKILEEVNKLKRNLKKAGIDEKDDLCMEKDACVLITKGVHADHYGTIESIDEDVSRLTVALAICGTNKKKEVISISQYNVKIVTETEFLKYSKYVNKSKAERVEKETSDQLMRKYSHQDDSNGHGSANNDDYERKHHHRHSSKGHRHEESKKSRKH